MSKIGSKQIIIPDTVTVSVDKQTVIIKGKAGELKIILPQVIKIDQQEKRLILKPLKNNKQAHSWHGLFRQLIANAVMGVEMPWMKKLEIVGTGYNVKLQGEDLVFKLGYSHPVIFKKKAGVDYQVDGNNKLTVRGVDKQLVGEIAYQIKIIKKPDSYKGKGIRYLGERIKLKPSKKVKAVGSVAAS
ncbi:50S ribosomal protein L6 [Candidatus Roizmanbacteria bacterium CG_4_8_14_3_um_filter_36_10]|uniref:50S ribosomal protein L6 n=1 Tax=Candidatus Roizmanbacteria bacterium CG_4_8_14_3_um_filter_36_10 TaxID=1974834 RepID=A0A2M8GMB5_9BACT|nr:MAG: 50S ribosomal protein L6 [Candidatus Roizmanbacteria bacterium CG_4_8_14_3_um_filter_36_10]